MKGMLQIYAANFLYGFNPFKMAVQFFYTASNFPILMAPNIFSQMQQAPGPDSRKVGKSMGINKLRVDTFSAKLKKDLFKTFQLQTRFPAKFMIKHTI